MSYTGTIIDQWCKEERARQAQLCQLTGLHASNMSRVRKGEKMPTFDMVKRIVRVWEEPWATELTIAWLRDQTPPSMRDRVTIAPRARRADARPIRGHDLRTAFENVVREAQHNHHLQRVIVNLSGLITRINRADDDERGEPPVLPSLGSGDT